jgi:hypothetical protein
MHRNEKGRFPKSQSGNGAGRPRNKLGEVSITALYVDWLADGAAAIEQLRKEQPAAYLKIMAGLFSKQREVEDDLFDGVTDEELAAIMEYTRKALGLPEEGDGGPNSATH